MSTTPPALAVKRASPPLAVFLNSVIANRPIHASTINVQLRSVKTKSRIPRLISLSVGPSSNRSSQNEEILLQSLQITESSRLPARGLRDRYDPTTRQPRAAGATAANDQDRAKCSPLTVVDIDRTFPSPILAYSRGEPQAPPEESAGARNISSRQRNLKDRPSVSSRACREIAIVGLDDGAANRQAHPHALRLRRKERMEDAFPVEVSRYWPSQRRLHAFGCCRA
jgi:hypothetical protein